MEKTNEIQPSPMDFLLLPVWVHKRLSVKTKGLLYAFLFIGVFDMIFFQDLIDRGFFKGTVKELIFKLVSFILISFIVGAVDLLCTMIPISELAIMIGKRSEKFVSSKMQIIMMKSYAVSHLIFIIPYTIFMYSGVDWNAVDVTSTSQIRLIFAILAVLLNFMPYFQLGILYRTISIRTRIQIFGKLILILATYFWMNISGSAIAFVVSVFQDILL